MMRLLLCSLGLFAMVSCAAREDSRPAAGAAPGADSALGALATAPAAVDTSAVEIRDATVEQVLAAVRASGGKAVLVNAWATWCGPCREEFPDLMRLNQAYRERGLRLVLVSTDFDDQRSEARSFLASHGVNFPSYFKVGDDMHFINTLDPRWTGALPATFLYDSEGRLRYFHEGKATYALLEEQLLPLLGDTKGRTKEIHS